METVILCIQDGEGLGVPMCTSQEIQQELVPRLLARADLPMAGKFAKVERRMKVKILTQQLLSGEFGGTEVPFWDHLRKKYGTRKQQVEELLGLLEPHLRKRHIVALRFQGETAVSSPSLLVRASELPAVLDGQAPARCEFQVDDFDAGKLRAWFTERTSAGRAPPLWPQLVAECEACENAGCQEVCAIILSCEAQSTDTSPVTLALAARSLFGTCRNVPYMFSIAIGPQMSEHLAGLEEFCAWAGGLSMNVNEPKVVPAVAEGLAGYLFDEAHANGLKERREFYAAKQIHGKCYLTLPLLQGSSSSSPPQGQSVKELLQGGESEPNTEVPTEAMLAVLSDTSLSAPRRWGASLRNWRMYRGLRDVVFPEPGGLGLELDEPELGSSEPSKRTWRLRATHPPASSLKMEEQSVLAALNMMKVTGATPPAEIAGRVEARPVALTFRCRPNRAYDPDKDDCIMMAAEVVVAEVREGLSPLKPKEPPLSTAVERVQFAKETAKSGPTHSRQAEKLLRAVKEMGSAKHHQAPAWLDKLPNQSAVTVLCKAASGLHTLAIQPSTLYRTLLYCGEVQCLTRVGLTCSPFFHLVVGAASESDAAILAVQPRLWRWTLCWGRGPTPQQRVGFWKWMLLSAESREQAQAAQALNSQSFRERGSVSSEATLMRKRSSLSSPSSQPSPASQMPLARQVSPSQGSEEAEVPEVIFDAESNVLDIALGSNDMELLNLSHGLGGLPPGVHVAQSVVSKLVQALGGSVPDVIIRKLLGRPYHLQRLWMLDRHGLPWLVKQSRCFQVSLAAHHPNVFRHLFAEGLAPELFYCLWLQSLFQGLKSTGEVIELLDLFVFERSHKIFVRAAVALFCLMEKQILGKSCDDIMKVLLDPSQWNLPDGRLLGHALQMKVTRSMLHSFETT